MIAEFDYYKTFYYVAKNLNITQASKELCLSQPSVTKSIQQLETLLGCKLFVRNNKGVQLTREGKILYRRVMPAYLMITNAEDELRNKSANREGVIRIGTSGVITNFFLAPFIRDFHETYPLCKIEIVALETGEYAAVKNGKVDFAIDTQITSRKDSSLMFQPLAISKELVIAGKKYAHLADKVLSVKDLLNYPILMVSKNYPVWTYYNELFLSYGYHLQPSIEVSAAHILPTLVSMNLGISFIREHYINDSIYSHELIRLTVDFPLMDGGEITLITNRKQELPPEAVSFIDILYKL